MNYFREIMESAPHIHHPASYHRMIRNALKEPIETVLAEILSDIGTRHDLLSFNAELEGYLTQLAGIE